jgi:thiamine biosynthesis protein ThiS
MAEVQSALGSIRSPMTIVLNGEPFDVPGPLTVAGLLARLDIDARRVAVEHNLVVLKRATYDTTELGDGDQVEIVNFVGGGETGRKSEG